MCVQKDAGLAKECPERKAQGGCLAARLAEEEGGGSLHGQGECTTYVSGCGRCTHTHARAHRCAAGAARRRRPVGPTRGDSLSGHGEWLWCRMCATRADHAVAVRSLRLDPMGAHARQARRGESLASFYRDAPGQSLLRDAGKGRLSGCNPARQSVWQGRGLVVRTVKHAESKWL